jgi:two-component system phosphate regulon sensor histidine kinase PhoR
VFIILKIKNQIIDYFLFFAYFIVIFFLLDLFRKKTDILILNEVKKDKAIPKSKLEVDNLAEWTEQTNREIAQLKANEQFRKEFIGDVAHELKTPIFNIQGFVSTLLDGAINDPQVNLKYLERTDKNVQRLITLVKDLDTISKLETGKIKPDYSVFDIYDVVKEVFEILEVKALEYGVRLRTNVQKGYYVKADREKIMEVIHNLVLNSIIYGKKDGETFVSISEKDEKIVVEVVDNGIGIDKKHLKHIFERFYRVDKSRSRERGGSGLGLSIVKHIIDSHNEILSVKSELGVGTSFSFTLQKEKTKH